MTQAIQPRVLIVEPNAHIRRLITTLLRALPVTDVCEARTPDLAGASLLAHPVDLVIMDLAGDTTDSMLFIHRLRRGEFGDSAVPVLAMSASSHHAVLEQAWAAGIDEVVAKPLSAIELIERAAQLLRSHPVRAGDQQVRSAAAE